MVFKIYTGQNIGCNSLDLRFVSIKVSVSKLRRGMSVTITVTKHFCLKNVVHFSGSVAGHVPASDDLLGFALYIVYF